MKEEYLVRDCMSAPASSLPKDACLLDAVLTFRRTGFRHLPIVDDGRIVGIISERDIQRVSPSLLSNVVQEEYNSVFEKTRLKDVMTRDPVTVTPDTPLRDAAIILNDQKVGCLPVAVNGTLVGIITVIDMLHALILVLPAGTKATT
jgi:acetoin utilization protein AcuB